MAQKTEGTQAPEHQAQAAAVEIRSGWQKPQPETLPEPTYWPAVLAIGVVSILWGIVTTFIISGIGFVLTALAIYGWVRELLYEQQDARRNTVE
jgi:hypothetical protein